MRYFTYVVGLDVHWTHTNLVVLNRHGKVVRRLKICGPWSEVVAELKRMRGKVAVCYEASCGYGYLYDQISQVVERVVVAHPGQLRLIFRSKRKNDRVDAKKLATLLYLDEVPPVYVPSQDVRAWRQLIVHRSRLVKRRTAAKNACRALLRSVGLRAPKGLWTRRGMKWLREQEFPHRHGNLQRDLLVDEIEAYHQQIRRVEKELGEYSRDNPAVQLLRTIPGVGLRTAEAMVAYLDDPHRFRSSKSLGAYLGLVPCQDQSGSTNRLGHITREGPALARGLLCEAAWQGIRRSPTIQRYFQRIEQGNRERKKIALVATAHYLARVMHAILRKGVPWQELAQVA
jgi:transposase